MHLRVGSAPGSYIMKLSPAIFHIRGYVTQVVPLCHCRALAALLKELSKTGLREVAFEIFDWLRSLDEQLHPDYAGLLDVFTYTTMIVSCWQ